MLTLDSGALPDWLGAAMPPGYQNRLREMQRLSEELRAMDRFGRLLWQTGSELTEAVADLSAALEFEVEPLAAEALAIRIDGSSRLLCYVSMTDQLLEKRDTDLGHVFRLVHEIAGKGDRVALVKNVAPSLPPSERGTAASGEALDLLRRLGVNLVTGPTLFELWTLSLQDEARARTYFARLHDQDGGIFETPRLGSG